MKKLTSVILSVLMVVSLFSCLFTGTTVSATGETGSVATNLIVNGDFESFNVNTAGNNTTLPGLGWRSVNSVFPTDKTKGQWYRSTGGLAPSAAPDLDANYSKITGASTYPTYFGPNNQMVLEPGVEDNHVLRAVQDLYTQVEPKDNGEYALTFRFKLPSNDTGLSFFNLFFVSPKLNSENGQSIQNNLRYPFSITSAELGSKTTNGITATLFETNADNNDGYKYNYLRIGFDKANTDWQTVEVAIKTEKVTHENAQPDVYTVDETDYTSPVLVKIGFDTDGINLSDKITDETITNATSYRKKAIYFDDFAMYEVVNCVGAAEFYDVNGNPLPDEQAYTKVTTTVGGEATSTVCVGDEVTATVADYDTTSGAYTFLGWYDEAGVKVSTSETFTFTATDGETYTPRIGSANLLGGSGSFENYENSESLAVALPTGISSVNDITADNIPNYSGNNKWATNENAGYLGATWPETIYDKDGNNYQQVATYKKIRLLNTFNVVEDATIAKSGRKYLHINGGGASSLGLENLNKNTDYKLSFYLLYSGVNANKIKSVGVTTTVNISNATLQSQGMLITLENAVPSHKITVAKCDSTELSKVSTTEWQKITVDFNSGNLEKLYLAIVSTSGKELDYYIDDMVLVKAGNANSVSAANVEFHDANGGTVVSSNEYAKADIIGNFDGTYTASIDYDRDSGAYAFKGWYYSGKLVSTDETFAIDTTSYSNLSLLKAVMISTNLLGDAGSFEGYENNKLISYNVPRESSEPPTNDKWAAINYYYVKSVHGNQTQHCYEGSDDASEKSDPNKYSPRQVSPRSGNVMLKFETDSQAAVRAIPVTPNTQYKLTFYINVPDYQNRFTEIYLCNTFSTVKQPSVHIYKQSLSKNFYGDNYDKWKKVEMEFNSDNNKTLYLYIVKTASTNPNVATTKDIYNDCFIDDLSLIAMPKVDGISYKGASIRAHATEDKPQALRHKFEIKKSLINEGIALYSELVGYGSVAIRTDYLGGKELVKDGVYTYNDTTKKAVTGVAYQKDAEGNVTTNKIFQDTGESIVFTAALTGIGKTSSGTNYAAFGYKYSVRNYLIFRNGTKETIVYTETQSYSIFDVMKYIIDTYEADTSTQNDTLRNDYNTIQSILNSDTDQKTAYEAWLAKQQSQ